MTAGRIAGPPTVLAAWREAVDAELDRRLPPADLPPVSLHEAMRYALFAGGKRLRPVLCLAGANAVGGEESTVLPVAAALEMIHTYSLVHDDLPAMDDDSLRRGRPTLHVAFGEATAILAGDALLTLAFETIARGAPGSSASGANAAVCALVARAAGAAGMVGGQQLDLDATGTGDTDEARLLAIHKAKTGALITASVCAGALACGAGEEEMTRLSAYGEAVGLAFQIVDDILDVEATTEQLGKSAGKDGRDGKLTFPSLLGLDESKARVRDLVARAHECARPFGARGRTLAELADYMAARTS
jgi:geranylgeranyl pyrophosphate synthase